MTRAAFTLHLPQLSVERGVVRSSLGERTVCIGCSTVQASAVRGASSTAWLCPLWPRIRVLMPMARGRRMSRTERAWGYRGGQLDRWAQCVLLGVGDLDGHSAFAKA
jgi:hypothetical protein